MYGALRDRWSRCSASAVKKTISAKLKLTTNTLRALQSSDLGQVAGGTTGLCSLTHSPSKDGPSCPVYLCTRQEAE